MKLLLPLLLVLACATSALAQNADSQARARLRAPAVRPNAASTNGILSDLAGGQPIPQPILAILADRRIDPNVAYSFLQISRKPLDTWTMAELAFVAQNAPTLVETGIPIFQIQMLYQFWGLDPGDVFNPSLAGNWQTQSTALDPRSSGGAGAISSADCQVDISLMTVGTYRTCMGGGQ